MLKILYTYVISQSGDVCDLARLMLEGMTLSERDSERFQRVFYYTSLFQDGMPESDPRLYQMRQFYIEILSDYFTSEADILEILPEALREITLPNLRSIVKQTEIDNPKVNIASHHTYLHTFLTRDHPLLQVPRYNVTAYFKNRVKNSHKFLTRLGFLTNENAINSLRKALKAHNIDDFEREVQELDHISLTALWLIICTTNSKSLVRWFTNISPYPDEARDAMAILFASYGYDKYHTFFETRLKKILDDNPRLNKKDESHWLHNRSLERLRFITTLPNNVIPPSITDENGNLSHFVFYIMIHINLDFRSNSAELLAYLECNHVDLLEWYKVALCNLDVLHPTVKVNSDIFDILYLIEIKLRPNKTIITKSHFLSFVDAENYVGNLIDYYHDTECEVNMDLYILKILHFFPWILECNQNTMVHDALIKFLVVHNRDIDIFKYIISHVPTLLKGTNIGNTLLNALMRASVHTHSLMPPNLSEKLEIVIRMYPNALNEIDSNGIAPLGYYYLGAFNRRTTSIPFVSSDFFAQNQFNKKTLHVYNQQCAPLVQNPLATVCSQRTGNGFTPGVLNEFDVKRAYLYFKTQKSLEINALRANSVVLNFALEHDENTGLTTRSLAVRASKPNNTQVENMNFTIMQDQIYYASRIFLLFYMYINNSDNTANTSRENVCFWNHLRINALLMYFSVISSLFGSSSLSDNVQCASNSGVNLTGTEYDTQSLLDETYALIDIFSLEYYLPNHSDDSQHPLKKSIDKTYHDLTVVCLKSTMGIISSSQLYGQIKNILLSCKNSFKTFQDNQASKVTHNNASEIQENNSIENRYSDVLISKMCDLIDNFMNSNGLSTSQHMISVDPNQLPTSPLKNTGPRPN